MMAMARRDTMAMTMATDIDDDNNEGDNVDHYGDGTAYDDIDDDGDGATGDEADSNGNDATGYNNDNDGNDVLGGIQRYCNCDDGKDTCTLTATTSISQLQ